MIEVENNEQEFPFTWKTHLLHDTHWKNTKLSFDSYLYSSVAGNGTAHSQQSCSVQPCRRVIENKPAPQSTPTPSSEPALRYQNYSAPGALGNSAGEPTIGVNWQSGNAMFIAALETLRIKFDDTASPALATWEAVSAPNTSIVTSDPILFTDSDSGPFRTNRTFVSQLLGKTSLMAFTDDDGATWTPSQGSGINSGVDHQTVGGGPYAKILTAVSRAARSSVPVLTASFTQMQSTTPRRMWD